MPWYGTKKAAELVSMDKSRILVFDLETTGFSATLDEILEITILDGYGRELFSSYIKPIRHKSWPAAQRIHGISYAMVENAPTIKKVKKQIQEIFNNGKLVVGYNVGFDIGFIEAAGIVLSGTRFDVMTAFASYRAAVDHTIYRNCKLTECAEYFGHSFKPHDSANDARATLHCFDSLIQDKRFTTYKPKEKVQVRTETPVVKRKTRFTVAFKSGKWRSIAVGLVLFVAGAFALISWSNIVVKNLDDIKLLLGYIKDHFMSDSKVMIAVIAVVVGGLMVLSRLLRMIILFPKWVLVHIQRIIKRIRGFFD